MAVQPGVVRALVVSKEPGPQSVNMGGHPAWRALAFYKARLELNIMCIIGVAAAPSSPRTRCLSRDSEDVV